mgnify:FL=1
MQRYLTIGDVCDRLGIDRRTVSRWLSAGELPAIRLSPRGQGRIRIDPADLERFLAERRIGGRAVRA